MKLKKRIFTPGPTEVPPEVLGAMSQPIIHHRTEAFQKIHRDIIEGLQYVFNTKNPVLILTSSGTGAMEAALANVTRPGEKIIVTPCGKFGERWGEIARAFKMDAVGVEVEWGECVSPESIEKALSSNPDVSVVFTNHCETSTGVVHDIKRIAEVVRAHDALLVVDAITGLLAEDLDTDEWGIDVVIGGSQKGFMIPPGLSFVSLGPRAIERVKEPGHSVYYFDLAKAVKSFEKVDTPYTPAVSLFAALYKALKMIRSEGRDNVIRRHKRNACAVREAVRALGLELFSKAPCNATTAVLAPEGTAGKIVKMMDEEYGLRIAGGQGKLKGKIFRLGHLGFYDETDMYTLISALEAVLLKLGISREPAGGVEALLRSFKENG